MDLPFVKATNQVLMISPPKLANIWLRLERRQGGRLSCCSGLGPFKTLLGSNSFCCLALRR